ncbi:MAG: hypothetical protein ACREON_14685 [Gemmatimonadaceae bacterium]
MHYRPSTRKAAREIYRHFKALPGSEYIATEFALHGLMQSVAKHRPRTVLEIGPGIGTTSAALVSVLDRIAQPYTLVCVEHEPFCIEQFNRNLAGHHSRLSLVRDLDDPAVADKRWDFVVLDGGVLDERYFNAIAPRGMVFVEGSRPDQRDLLVMTALGMGRHLSHRARRPLSGRKGYHLYQFDATRPEMIRADIATMLMQGWHDTRPRLMRRIKRRLRRLYPTSTP